MTIGHAKFSPSSAERWFSCPGSVALAATLPPVAFKSSKYAAEGTVAHGLAANLINKKVDFTKLIDMIGTTVTEDGFPIEITDAMIEGVTEYADAIAATEKRIGGTYKPAPLESKTEVKVKVEVHPELWGTADKIIYRKGDELHVFDFKYGKGLVLADENKQGLIYLVAAEDTFAGRACAKHFFHIVQPRAEDALGATWRAWELPKGRLATFRGELTAAIQAAKTANAARCAGKWCKYCPANGWADAKTGAFVCPESAAIVQEAAGKVFTKVEVQAPASKEIGMASLPPVAALTPGQLAKALDWEDAVNSWFESARACAFSLLTADANAVPGYKLVEGKSNRVWGSVEETSKAFSMLGDKCFAPRKLLSPAQMEKVVGKEEVAKYAVKPPGKLAVARSDDKRQAAGPVSGKAEDVFAPIMPGGASKGETASTDEDFFGVLAQGPKEEEPKQKAFWPQ